MAATTPDSPAERRQGILALIIVQALFGVHYSIAVHVVRVIPPAAWALIRSASAALLLSLLVVVCRRAWPRRLGDWVALAGLSVFGVTLNQILFVEGLSRSYTLHSVLVMSSIPLQALTFATLFGQERVTARKLASVLIGAVGILVLVEIDQIIIGESRGLLLDNHGRRAESFWDTVLAGDLMVLTNAASFSLFLTLGKRYSARFDSLVLTATTFTLGTPLVALYGLPALLKLDLTQVPATTWWYGAFIVIGPTIGSYLLNFVAIRRLSTSIVGLFVYLQFVVAATIGVTWLHESFGLRHAIAAVLVLSGLTLRFARWGRRPESRSTAPAAPVR